MNTKESALKDGFASSSGLLPGLSIVIPVFNAELNLPELTERLKSVLRTLDGDHEVIFVDDNSQDGSWRVISQLAKTDDTVRGFLMMRNYGQHNALLCGIREVRFSVTVTMDDDLQNPPEEIPRLLAKLDEGLDVVYGAPQQETHGMLRDLASQITKIALQKAMGSNTARHVSAFRAFRTEVRQAFDNYRGPHVSIDVLLTWGTANFGMLRVQHAPRIRGTSNYTVRKLLQHAMNMITGFTTIPLQLATWIGLVFTGFGFLVLCFVLVRYWIRGDVAPGFPFLASLIVIFSGAQLFALGIFGEYLARIHLRTMDRPSYSVRTATDGGET
jgi:glycosyltransferase involved in cell wall biosynthesis